MSVIIRYQLWIPALVALVVALTAVSSDSFWIDEGLTGYKAIAPSLQECWQRLLDEGNTNLNMLLYMFTAWGWEKLFGHSEFGLRALNIPFLILSAMALWVVTKGRARALSLAFLCVSPFVWFYVNEARTYGILIGFSAVMTAAFYQWISIEQRKESHDVIFGWILSIGGILLVWTHIIGIVFEFSIGCAVLFVLGRRNLLPFLKQVALPLVISILFHLGLLFYLMWLKKQGVEANAIGKTEFINIAFWVYEFFGFQGLGQGRNDLRSLEPVIFMNHMIPWLLVGLTWCAATISLLFCPWRKLFLRNTLLIAGFLVLLPLVLFLLIGVVKEIRFLPRYAAVSFPAFCLVLGLLFSHVLQSGKWIKIPVFVLLLTLLASSLSLRFAERHKKDDYRGAVALVKDFQHQGKSVLWAADRETAWFYGPSFDGDPEEGVVSLQQYKLKRPPLPQVVLLSKVDIYDPGGEIRKLLETEKYTKETGPNTFTIYQ